MTHTFRSPGAVENIVRATMRDGRQEWGGFGLLLQFPRYGPRPFADWARRLSARGENGSCAVVDHLSFAALTAWISKSVTLLRYRKRGRRRFRTLDRASTRQTGAGSRLFSYTAARNRLTLAPKRKQIAALARDGAAFRVVAWMRVRGAGMTRYDRRVTRQFDPVRCRLAGASGRGRRR